jgi:hypothetical protein
MWLPEFIIGDGAGTRACPYVLVFCPPLSVLPLGSFSVLLSGYGKQPF